MGGVDRGDQVRGYYSCRTKCRKFYKYIFHFLPDIAITNAFILQKGYCSSAPFKAIKEFRLQLASELIGDYCSRRRAGRGSGVVRFSLSIIFRPPSLRKIPKRGESTRRHDVVGPTVEVKECLYLLVLPRVQGVVVPHGRATHRLLMSYHSLSVMVTGFGKTLCRGYAPDSHNAPFY